MYQFISNKNHRGLRLWDSTPKLLAAFINMGDHGFFKTEDETIALELKKHPQFGKAFSELNGKMPKFQEEKQVNYKVEGENNQVIEVPVREEKPVIQSVDTKKFIRLGELKGLLLKPDGDIKKTASKDLIEEYEKLKIELGV